MDFTDKELSAILKDPDNRRIYTLVRADGPKPGRMIYDQMSKKLRWIPVPLRKHGIMTVIHQGGRVSTMKICDCEEGKCPE